MEMYITGTRYTSIKLNSEFIKRFATLENAEAAISGMHEGWVGCVWFNES